ncbi:MAG: sodium:calcium antiporter [Ruminococcaceae bacterium]|nr:sodium:calcium antiporter [Oscillospiraceae bacterium]
MELFGSLGLLALGILLVVKGGDAFVEAAGGLARGLGLPSFLVGATVVSLATTLPEILVSVLAASRGKVDMAIGNALGSVTANTAMVLASGMVLLPGAEVGKGMKIPCLLLLGAIGTLWGACLSGALTWWGAMSLGAICVSFLGYNVHQAKKELGEEKQSDAGKWVWKFLLGAAAIVGGSHFLVTGGSGIAAFFGVPERIIAVTLLAVGTGLPELVTTLAAVKKGEAALSIGNIIGANIIDLTLILPLCSMASHGILPISRQNLTIDLPGCALALLVAVLPLILRGKSSRIAGVLLWLLYGGYLMCSF